MVDRPRLLNVRFSEAEMAMLREVAEAWGLSISDTVRQMVRRAHTEAASPVKPSQRQRRKR